MSEQNVEVVGKAVRAHRLEIERIEAVGPERVIAFLRGTASGRTSGLPFELRVANVYELSGGLIERVRVFRDRQEALEAVGLTE